MAKTKLGVALIGQGFMGRAHSNAFHQVKHFFDLPFELERKVIVGRDAERLRSMAEQWEWSDTATDWRAVVDRDDIDVVDVATPNVLHAEMAIAAAEAGKIVLCEKPLATSAEEGARMVGAASKRPNLVWFNYRRVPAIAYARQLVEEGRIGRVFHYRANYLNSSGLDPRRAHTWKFQKEHAGSGVLGDLMSHVVDTALYLNGPIEAVSGMQHTFHEGRDVDDTTVAMVRFANGSVGTFEASRYGTGCRNRNFFEMQGDRGMVRFNLEDFSRLEFFDAGDAPEVQAPRPLLVPGPNHPYSQDFWKPGHPIGYEHTFIAALADFLSALGKDEPYHPDFRDGQQVQVVLDAIARSAGSGGWVKVD